RLCIEARFFDCTGRAPAQLVGRDEGIEHVRHLGASGGAAQGIEQVDHRDVAERALAACLLGHEGGHRRRREIAERYEAPAALAARPVLVGEWTLVACHAHMNPNERAEKKGCWRRCFVVSTRKVNQPSLARRDSTLVVEGSLKSALS